MEVKELCDLRAPALHWGLYQLIIQLLALRYRTTCRLTSQLRRHSRSSDSRASRHVFALIPWHSLNPQTICTRLYTCVDL